MTGTAVSDLSDVIRTKLLDASCPLKLAEIAKGLPKPKKTKPAEFQQEVLAVLQEHVNLGLAFCYPSGKNAENRYWSRDEKNLLRVKAAELAATPQTMAALAKMLGQEIKGVDKGFVESVVRELIGDEKLFVHPATGKGGELFGSAPPPPPVPRLQQAKFKAKFDKLVTDAKKLLDSSGSSPQDLVQLLTLRLEDRPEAPMAAPVSPTVEPMPKTNGQSAPPVMATGGVELDELLLKAVGTAPVLSLKDLRETMPREYQGKAFDEAVLRLAYAGRVLVSQDANPARFSDAEKAEYVQDGLHVFTTIAKRD